VSEALHVHEWGAGTPVVAIHGITASHLAWATVARHLPDRRVIAPDLRGRGASSTLPGPFGMRRHADDIAAVLDGLGIDRVPLVGHSMGAFVALVTANRHPDRVSSLLLVDGGLPLELPPGYSLDTVAELLGPAAARLTMEFPNREAYREFWRRHPAFADDWSDDLEAYVDYDLHGSEPRLRSRTSGEAMRGDQLELYGSEAVTAALDSLAHPTTLLWAPRGLQDETPGLYPPAAIQRWRAALPAVAFEEVPDTNHYTIVMAEPGASVVAGHVRQLT
jgi:pimeloyl-ACP methyl ester carboxylesterase